MAERVVGLKFVRVFLCSGGICGFMPCVILEIIELLTDVECFLRIGGHFGT